MDSVGGEKYNLLTNESSDYVYGGKDYDKVDPVTLTWENINVYLTVEEKKSMFNFGKSKNAVAPDQPTKRQILKDVNGIVTPGTLLAIMGASGAGKTSLMNVLTSRSSDRLTVEGQVRVNGRLLGDDIKYVSAYVQQDDLFLPELTVREHLWFQAQLRLDRDMPEALRKKRIDDAMSELNMTELADNRIGKPGQGKSLSGGERKRLTFASEVLTNPALMFCDEPTSGLDSYMAQTIIETLRGLAARGRTILCTIHQPSSEVFSYMDRLCLLAEGRMAAIGTTDGVDKFFQSIGYTCPVNFNPADFYIQTLAIIPEREKESRERVHVICDKYQESHNCTETRKQIARLSDVDQFLVEMAKIHDSYSEKKSEQSESDILRYKASWGTQFRLLFWRCWTNSVRNPAFFRARVGQMVILAILMAFLYQNQPYNQEGVQNIDGAIFSFGQQFGFCGTLLAINGITLELDLFFREHQSGIYRVDTYFITFILVESLAFILSPVLYSLIVYWSIGFYNSAEAALTFILTLVLQSLNSMAFGHILATMTRNLTLALILGPALVTPLSFFGGFFINIGTVPAILKPMEYLSWFRYSNEILYVNQWRNVEHLVCEYAPPIYKHTINGTEIVGYDTSVCFDDGLSVIDNLNFDPYSIGRDFGILFALLFGYELCAYAALWYHGRKKQ